MNTKITKVKKLSIALCLIFMIQSLVLLFTQSGTVKASQETGGGYLLRYYYPCNGGYRDQDIPSNVEKLRCISKEWTYWIVLAEKNVSVSVTDDELPAFQEGVRLPCNPKEGSAGCWIESVKKSKSKDSDGRWTLYLDLRGWYHTGWVDYDAYDSSKKSYKGYLYIPIGYKGMSVRISWGEIYERRETHLYGFKKPVSGALVDHSDMLNDSKRYTFIKRLYLRALHRGASEEDLKAHFNKTTLQEAIDIMLSQEAKQKNDLSTNEKFVTYCYDVLLGRQPDAGGKAAWTNALNNGTSRSSVINSFIQSSEFRNMYN